MSNWTRPNQFGWESQKPFKRKSTQHSTSHWPMTGKNIWPTSNFLLKDNWNSKLSYSFQREPHSIYSKQRRRRTTSNYTLEESSLWTTVMISFQTISVSSKVLLTQKIYHWTFPENFYNKTRSWKSLKKYHQEMYGTHHWNLRKCWRLQEILRIILKEPQTRYPRRSNQQTKTCRILEILYLKIWEELVSFKDYVARMKEGQKDIFFITGETKS